MSWGWWLICVAAGLGIGGGLYALHRLCLWLEDAGYLYYVRKKPRGSSGGLGSLVELQKALEPTTRYVVETKEERVQSISDAGGERDALRFFPPHAGKDALGDRPQ